MSFRDSMEQAYRFFASPKAALGLFGIVGLASLPGTVIEMGAFYSGPLFVTLLALLGINLIVCTTQKIKSLPRPVFILHAGVIMILAGGVVSSTGYIATVNVYEGKAVDKAFRWDRQEDMPLGMILTVEKINMEFYPAPVKVGVMSKGEKAGLFELHTGGTFAIGGYQVRVDELDISDRNLKLSVHHEGQLIGRAETAGAVSLPSDFPYVFVLVAYKNPTPNRVWVDLRLSKDNEVIAAGRSEVNSPFAWQGLSFHNTKIEADSYGNPYAGIQITKDPGRPVVYLGFVTVLFGSGFYLLRRFSFVRQLIG